MTTKEWEKHTLEEDRKIRKKIDKYRNKGTNRVILGLLIALFGFDSLNDVIKQFTKVATEYTKTAGKKNMSLDVIAGAVKAGSQETDGRLAMVALAFILLALAVFFWAVTARNKADAIETKMFRWMPDEEEEIKKNVRWLLKEIYKLTRYKKLKPKEEHEKAVLVEGGHIVLNKGYRENTEKYKAL